MFLFLSGQVLVYAKYTELRRAALPIESVTKPYFKENQKSTKPAKLRDGAICHPPLPVDFHNQVVADNLADDPMSMQPPTP